MRPHIVRFASLLLLATIAACSSPEAGAARLKTLKEGMSRADVIAQLGAGPIVASGADTVRVVNGFRDMQYLIDGKRFEVLYARDEPGDVKEPVKQAVETPIVIVDDKVLGWGWKFYVEAMKKYQLPTPLVAVDTTPKAPQGPGGMARPAQPGPDPTKAPPGKPRDL